ncbi:MAG TPA: hypothetical protein VHU24_08820 [Solirubrobacterales bacterium]|nr:hypothetical protein [Solirubrobacterales bacterium]
MVFHVEINSGFKRARAFNLDEATMRSTILDPWMRRRVIVLGDKDWEPKDCKLIILEGPELADIDLSMGRGWSNAERGSRNVTRALVDDAVAAPAEGPVVAVLAENAAAEAEVGEMLEQLELEKAPWAELRARILGMPSAAAGGPGYAAVLAVESPTPSASWFFDAGLARGALGSRAVVARLGDAAIPVELADVDAMSLKSGDVASVRALADRLAK